MSPRKWWLALALSAAVPACNPYNRTGEFYAGPIDAREFPRPYKGGGAVANSSNGTIIATLAFANDAPVGYFQFPVPRNVNPLRLRTRIGTPQETDQPVAYVFDPETAEPFPTAQRCAKPENYVYDVRRDFVRFDEQGNIFSVLPRATFSATTGTEAFTYVPVVAESKVTTNGTPCQEPKSAENIVSRPDVTIETDPPKIPLPDALRTGRRDGKYIAWAIIDPSADVRFPEEQLDPITALGPQKWGWFDHFLLAYIDGGYIPTTEVTIPGMMGMPDQREVHAVEQMMFVPTVVPDPDDPTMPADNAAPGSGWDVVQHRRGEAGYSPICHVIFFDPPDPLNPVTNEAAIPAAAMLPDEGLRIYCLQYQQ
jgi:hypothetical protein